MVLGKTNAFFALNKNHLKSVEYGSAMGHTFGKTQTHGPASRQFVTQMDILGDI